MVSKLVDLVWLIQLSGEVFCHLVILPACGYSLGYAPVPPGQVLPLMVGYKRQTVHEALSSDRTNHQLGLMLNVPMLLWFLPLPAFAHLRPLIPSNRRAGAAFRADRLHSLHHIKARFYQLYTQSLL